MTSQQYNNQYGGGYGQSNPYSQQEQGYGGYNNYAPPPQQQGMCISMSSCNNLALVSDLFYSGRNRPNIEMQPLTGADATYDDSSNAYGGPNGAPGRDPNAILNECRTVGRAIDDLDSRLVDLQRMHGNYLAGTHNTTNRDIVSLDSDIMSGYRGLTDRVKRIKNQPQARDARNKAQVDALDRRMRKAIQHYQEKTRDFRKEMEAQQRRQYLIVRPDATEAELREAVDANGDTQIFQQALLNSDRRGQAQSTLRNVQQRHQAIQEIERTMIELQQLFQDLDAIVVEQDVKIVDIEQKAEETHTQLEGANVEMGHAVSSARAARKKKWICLGIVVAIILILIIIILAYGATQGWFSHSNNSNTAKTTS